MKLRRSKTVLLALVLPLALVLLGGCAQGTGTKGYIDGGSTVREIKPADRVAVGTVSGKSLEGKPLNLADYRGKIVVLNVWWSNCPPCRLEGPILDSAARALMPKGVVFLGINTRDGSTSAPLAYQRTHHTPYPSIFDKDGQNMLAFKSVVSPNSIPSTLVIDKEGKVAAVVLGALPSRTTLLDLVQDAGGPAVSQKATSS